MAESKFEGRRQKEKETGSLLDNSDEISALQYVVEHNFALFAILLKYKLFEPGVHFSADPES